MEPCAPGAAPRYFDSGAACALVEEHDGDPYTVAAGRSWTVEGSSGYRLCAVRGMTSAARPAGCDYGPPRSQRRPARLQETRHIS